MKASEWRNTIDPMANRAQGAIVSALLDPTMRAAIDWVGIPVTQGAHTGILFVATDALMVGEPGDAVRVNVTCESHQMVCDALGLQLPTPRMLDIIYENVEIPVEACTFSPDANGNISIIDPADGIKAMVSMMSIAAMFAHDACVSAGVRGQQGLVCNSGKAWVLSSKLGPASPQGGLVAANYGLFLPSAPNLSVSNRHRMWQDLGTMHNEKHVDNSQVCYGVHPQMVVDGQVLNTADVIKTPGIASLISHEGALPFSRHPSLPVFDPGFPVGWVFPPVEQIRVHVPGQGPVGQEGGAAKTAGKILSMLVGAVGVGFVANWKSRWE